MRLVPSASCGAGTTLALSAAAVAIVAVTAQGVHQDAAGQKEEDTSCLLHNPIFRVPHGKDRARFESSRTVMGTTTTLQSIQRPLAAEATRGREVWDTTDLDRKRPDIPPAETGLALAGSEREQEHTLHASSSASTIPDGRSLWKAAQLAALELSEALTAHMQSWSHGVAAPSLSTGFALLCAVVSLLVCIVTAVSLIKDHDDSGTGYLESGQTVRSVPSRSRQLAATRPAPSAQSMRALSWAALPVQRTAQSSMGTVSMPASVSSIPVRRQAASSTECVNNRCPPTFNTLGHEVRRQTASSTECANNGCPPTFNTLGHEELPGTPQQRMPPALCPPLVLHDRETHLAIPASALAAAGKDQLGQEFDVLGPLHTPVFRVAVHTGTCGPALSLFVPRLQANAPWVDVRLLREDNQDAIRSMLPEGTASFNRVLEIVEQSGALYGLIVAQRSGSYWAIHRSLTGLVVEGDRGCMRLRATTEGGQLMAFTSLAERRLPAGKGMAQQLELQVQPGVDPLLVLACMLTIILLF
uniref:Uncharacterized protein n=1 Tax=Pyrodinium bahamense TaxID=73915 RepID=A0A7S0AN51_9DINO|mmetsp:Transcript_36992/g.102822  ORF Transcript_36992/g.102822 Transcript_36992/m.102822 type:complete len:528 (+) Transcript_36992:109-1692(+)